VGLIGVVGVEKLALVADGGALGCGATELEADGFGFSGEGLWSLGLGGGSGGGLVRSDAKACPACGGKEVDRGAGFTEAFDPTGFEESVEAIERGSAGDRGLERCFVFRRDQFRLLAEGEEPVIVDGAFHGEKVARKQRDGKKMARLSGSGLEG